MRLIKKGIDEERLLQVSDAEARSSLERPDSGDEQVPLGTPRRPCEGPPRFADGAVIPAFGLALQGEGIGISAVGDAAEGDRRDEEQQTKADMKNGTQGFLLWWNSIMIRLKTGGGKMVSS